MDLFLGGWLFLLDDHGVRVSAGSGEGGQGGGATGHGGVAMLLHFSVASGVPSDFVHLVVDAGASVQGAELYGLRVAVAGRVVRGNFLRDRVIVVLVKIAWFVSGMSVE